MALNPVRKNDFFFFMDKTSTVQPGLIICVQDVKPLDAYNIMLKHCGEKVQWRGMLSKEEMAEHPRRNEQMIVLEPFVPQALPKYEQPKQNNIGGNIDTKV